MAIINGTSGNDALNGTTSPDEMNGFGGNDQLSGGRGGDLLNGGCGNDKLDGGVGNDRLDGGAGADFMSGGDGSDTYIVDNIGDVVQESFDDDEAGWDNVESSLTYTLGFGVENLILTGSAAINGTGNGKNNPITGNDNNNSLSGLGGDDQLYGGGGLDKLYGGTGFDYMIGGDGDDQLLGGADDDQLYGESGNDLLDGGTGADYMDGDVGNDTYLVDNAGDVVQEFDFDEVLFGLDLVQSSVTYTLGFGIENLTLTGTAAIDGTGNEKNNVIIGNSADNVLSGLDGNDQLSGGSGADALIGGLGADSFKYKSVSDSPAGGGRDVIIQFQGGAGVGDQIDLTMVDANTTVAGNQAFIWGGPFTAGHLRYVGGVLSGNTDADAAAEIEIALVGGPALFVNPASAGTDILL